jgi:fibronectin-binding autotransporter adhesin
VLNYTVEGSAALSIAGIGEQAGQLNLNSGTLTIGAGGSYTLDDDVNIYGTGAIVLAGDLVAASTGSSSIQPFLTETGTLTINDQTLYLESGASLGGTITGSGTLNLSNGSYTLQSGLGASVAAMDFLGSATASLNANETYGGYFVDNGTITLNSDTLSLTGTTLLSSATLSGPGFLVASGDTTLTSISVLNGATLETTGTVEQDSGNSFISGGTLAIGATSAYTLDANQSITGGGFLKVAGTLNASGDGNSALNVAITDTGTISANLGTLDIGGNVLGAGTLSIGGAGTLLFSNSSTITSATTVNFNGGLAHLIVSDLTGFGAVLSDFATGNVIELTGINAGSVTGTLLTGGKEYQVNDSNGDTIILSFSTVQTASNLYTGVAQDGNAAVFHK